MIGYRTNSTHLVKNLGGRKGKEKWNLFAMENILGKTKDIAHKARDCSPAGNENPAKNTISTFSSAVASKLYVNSTPDTSIPVSGKINAPYSRCKKERKKKEHSI